MSSSAPGIQRVLVYSSALAHAPANHASKLPRMTPLNADGFTEHCVARGLNLVAVFALSTLGEGLRQAIIAAFPDARAYAQLLLIGNAGTALWRKVREAGLSDSDPVDRYARRSIEQFLEGRYRYEILYPGTHTIPLQQLGTLAGWHHDSPLGIGIHGTYGLWFAYRAVVLADSAFSETPGRRQRSPCLDCADQPCMNACPSGAVSAEPFDVDACAGFRFATGSVCAANCLARCACPVARQHRYDDDQIAYHYSFSLGAMRRYRSGER